MLEKMVSISSIQEAYSEIRRPAHLDDIFFVWNDAKELKPLAFVCPIPMGNAVRNVNRVSCGHFEYILSNSYSSLAPEDVLLVLDCVSMGWHPATWLHDKTSQGEVWRFIVTYQYLASGTRTSPYTFRFNIFRRTDNTLPKHK